MKRCVIIGGAPVNNAERIRSYFTAEDVFIFCDSGLAHRAALQVTPDLVIGDFDSHAQPAQDVETIVLPHEKDDTDTAYAVKEAMRRGFDAFLLTGCSGARLDHTLGNVQLLLMLHRAGRQALLVDDYAEMEIAGSKPVLIEDHFTYFSLINISGTAKGVTIEHAKFPLLDAEIPVDNPYGISNEVMPGCTACVTVKEGALLLLRIF